MLSGFLAWWVQQLHDAMPLRRRVSAADALVVRSLGGLDAAFAIRRRGAERPLARAMLDQAGLTSVRRQLPRRPGPVVLALPETMLLEQETTLPISAERSLPAILRHEMDLLTPFPADSLYWSWRVLRRDTKAGRMDLRLAFVPRAALAPLLAALTQIGLTPRMIEAPHAGGIQPIGLTAPDAAGGSARLPALACAALATAVLLIPPVRQELAIRAVDDRIAALRPQMAAADAVRTRLLADAAGNGIFASETARIGDAVAVLAAVTGALPDDSYLTQLTLRERALTITGRSSAAARLIGILSADPALTGLAFAAPVVRSAGDRGDQFTIRAAVAR